MQFHKFCQMMTDSRFYNPFDVNVGEFNFFLGFKLRIRVFDADYSRDAFAHILARKVFLNIFQQFIFDAIGVNGFGEPSAKP